MRMFSFHPRQKGQAIVEFGVSFVVFMVLLIGVIEFCHASWIYVSLVEAARRVARFTVTSPTTTFPNATAAEIRALLRTIPKDTVGVSDLTEKNVKISYKNFDGIPSIRATSETLVEVRIVNYKFKPFFPSGGSYGIGEFPLPPVTTRLAMESQGLGN
ncbi:MAG: pilus assembly protein [Acidobacteria bacterium]|nr:pilus assembly protein [Acidobacteriota bacterium]MBI3655974.1 pilus assembly protein [Acidobacteriota bacterium]